MDTFNAFKISASNHKFDLAPESFQLLEVLVERSASGDQRPFYSALVATIAHKMNTIT